MAALPFNFKLHFQLEDLLRIERQQLTPDHRRGEPALADVYAYHARADAEDIGDM